MNYKIVKQRVAFGENAGKEQYRVVPITTGTKSFQEIVDELVRRTAFSSGDIVGLVTALSDILCDYLQAGYAVQLGEMGNFRLTFGSRGFNAPHSFNAQRDIQNVRITYLPSKRLKNFDLNYRRIEE